jgi:hypothetical protein
MIRQTSWEGFMRKALLVVATLSVLFAPLTAQAITVMFDDDQFFGEDAIVLNGVAGNPVNIATGAAQTYFGFTVANIASTRLARVAAVDAVGTADKLTLTDAIFRNGSGATKTLHIQFSHTFSPVNEGIDLWWGASMSGSFLDSVAGALAAGDSVTMTSFGSFLDCSEEFCVTFTEQINNANPLLERLSYTVPQAGPSTLNNFAPVNPPQLKEVFSCDDISDGTCTGTANNSIVVQIAMTLGNGDRLRLPSSFSAFFALNEADLDASLASVVNEVPAPGTLLLLVSGLAIGLAKAVRRRSRR